MPPPSSIDFNSAHVVLQAGGGKDSAPGQKSRWGVFEHPPFEACHREGYCEYPVTVGCWWVDHERGGSMERAQIKRRLQRLEGEGDYSLK